MSGKVKNFLNKSGLGKTLRNIGTSAIANIPGVGSGIANAIRQLPTAATPLPGSEGEKTLVNTLKKIQDNTGQVPDSSQVQAAALAAIDSDMQDPRFPLRPNLADGQKDRTGFTSKSDKMGGDAPGSGVKPEKVTADSVMSGLKTNLATVVGIFILLIIAMRIPAVKRFVMGGASYVRKSYSGYRQRRSARRSRR